MRLDLALFAQAANTTADGKLNILGEFNSIMGTAGPIIFPTATLVLRIVGTALESGEHRVGLRQRNADGDLIWTSPDIPFALPAPDILGVPVRSALIVQMGPLVFPEFVTYTYEIVVDGQHLDDVELHVLRQQPPPSPGV
jgi:hypothetical protein